MNRLKTDHLGGVGFEWDDWRWEQDAVREAFFGLVSGWGIDPADSFIISGCVATLAGPIYNITAGFIAFEGEIFKVNAHSVSSTVAVGDALFWATLTTFDPTGLEPTKNLGSVNTYELRGAIVQNGVEPVPTFMPMEADRIEKRIADSVRPFFGEWVRVDLGGSLDVKQNTISDGSGATGPFTNPPDASSYFKYNIVGKVCTMVYQINQVRTTTFLAQGVASILLENLPFTAKDQTDAQCHANNTNHAQGLSGLGFCRIQDGGNRLIFSIHAPHEASAAFFNRGYVFSVLPDMSVAATPLSTYNANWNLRGTIVFEIN